MFIMCHIKNEQNSPPNYFHNPSRERACLILSTLLCFHKKIFLFSATNNNSSKFFHIVHNSPAARVLHCQLNPVNACYDALKYLSLLLHLIIWYFLHYCCVTFVSYFFPVFYFLYLLLNQWFVFLSHTCRRLSYLHYSRVLIVPIKLYQQWIAQ